MRCLIDAMLPPSTCGLLSDRGHGITPTDRGVHSLSDDVLIDIAGRNMWVVVTDNAVDFVHAFSCTVLLVCKDWWPGVALAERLAESLDRWAHAHPNPGNWAHWLDSTYR